MRDDLDSRSAGAGRGASGRPSSVRRSSRQRHPSLLPGGQGTQDQFLQPRDPQALIHLFRVASRMRTKRTLEAKVFHEREVALETGAMREPDQRPVEFLPLFLHRLVIPVHGAFLEAEHPGDSPNQAGLATAVRPGQHRDVQRGAGGREIEVEPVQRELASDPGHLPAAHDQPPRQRGVVERRAQPVMVRSPVGCDAPRDFSARDAAIVTEIDGVVRITEPVRGQRRIVVDGEGGENREYAIPRYAHVSVQEGEFIQAGDPLTEGAINPHDILSILGEKEMQRHLVDKIQEVYRSQSVAINDKHIEVIVRQMMRSVKIEEVNDTDFLIDEQVDRWRFADENARVLEAGGTPVELRGRLEDCVVEQGDWSCDQPGGAGPVHDQGALAAGLVDLPLPLVLQRGRADDQGFPRACPSCPRRPP